MSRWSLDAKPLRQAADWVERYRDFWEGQLDALARCLETPVRVSEVDLTVGGRYTLQMKSPEGESHTARGVYREIERPDRVVYTWARDEHPEHGESLITVEFTAVEGGTEVRMLHSGLPSAESVSGHEEGGPAR